MSIWGKGKRVIGIFGRKNTVSKVGRWGQEIGVKKKKNEGMTKSKKERWAKDTEQTQPTLVSKEISSHVYQLTCGWR